ncbi:hypothetical protein [Streptomyces sp. NPDC056987]|uniref:hypothetical protein n=1 Tax=Streptomyces sp. NPDC056987 TaxID=3345988 RepID=UPI003625A164
MSMTDAPCARRPLATLTDTWHIAVNDPGLLALQGWRATRAAPAHADDLSFPPYRMDEGLALALLVAESDGADIAQRAVELGLVVTGHSTLATDTAGRALCGHSDPRL